jgi:hypothetical protein
MFGEDEATPNYKTFFNFIKSTKCEKTNVAPLKREGFLHHDTTTKANILNQQFASVFTEEDMDNLPGLLSPFLKTGATLACFQSDGICP